MLRSISLLLIFSASIGLLALPQLAQAESVAKPLVMGIFPRRNPTITVRLFRPLQLYLSETLGRDVVLEPAPDFTAFQQRLLAGRYDLVHLNQYHYVEAHRDLGYEVVAQNEEQGESTIRAAIYVRDDSPYVDLDQLKGKKIIFGGSSQAMISYVVPTYLLRRAGLKAGDYQEEFAATPPDAVLATYLELSDAGCAAESARRMPMVANKIDTAALRVLAISDPLPHLAWAVKGDLAAEQKQRIQQALLQLGDSAEGRAVLKAAHLSGLNPAADSDYDIHRQIINRVNQTHGITARQ